MKRIAIAAVLCGLAVTVRAAGFNSAAKGTTTAGFLKMGAGARAMAMGEAYTAVADEANALYWNPGALTRMSGVSATFMHAAHLESSFYDYLACGQNLGSLGAWAASAQYFSAGEVAETDIAGAENGSFTPNDLAVTAGYGHELAGFGLGGSVKYIRSKILDTASTGAADLGILSPALFGGGLRLAAAALNLGGKMKFERDSESLPLTLRTGAALRLAKGWLGSADLVFPKDNKLYAAFGTEYARSVSGKIQVAGRLGYNNRTAGDLDGFTGISFGLGMGYAPWQIDYAVVPFGSLGLTHRISLSLRLGRASGPATAASQTVPVPMPEAVPAAPEAALPAMLEAAEAAPQLDTTGMPESAVPGAEPVSPVSPNH